MKSVLFLTGCFIFFCAVTVARHDPVTFAPVRTLLAILLLCLTCYTSLMKLGVVAWYEYNKTYIAQNLCENRNKPELNCCGKCVLHKKLAKAEAATDKDGKPLPVKVPKIELPLFIVPEQMVLRVRPQNICLHRGAPYQYPFTEDILFPVLHPPG